MNCVQIPSSSGRRAADDIPMHERIASPRAVMIVLLIWFATGFACGSLVTTLFLKGFLG